MREILRRMNSVTGMKGALVVTPDGLPIAADLPPGTDPETASGLGASVAGILSDWSQRAGAGSLRLGMIDASEARLFVSSIPWGYLIGIAGKQCPIGEARSEMHQATEQLGAICARLAHAVEEEEATQAAPAARRRSAPRRR